MELHYDGDQGMKDFIRDNRKEFERKLLDEAVQVRDKVDQINIIGNINLLDNAYNLALSVVQNKRDEVTALGTKEGVAWAGHSLTLAFKLEWIQAIRKTLWEFLYEYDKEGDKLSQKDEYYNLQIKINGLVDEFFRSFFLSYSSYKDKLLESKNKLVESLSAPIIPISEKISVLPLIGMLDEFRGNIIEEKVLNDIGKKGVQVLVLDFSGLAQMEGNAIHFFMKLLDGITMMGCKAIITGVRPEVVPLFIEQDLSFGKNIETKATLQQALKDFLEPK
ncbi:STAS domain-containing protein [Oceanobacillus massiliensis]|uniref:STAS domain-containing protein n=1 Tax=Oceanobacillus massiliensis TaxID=1465765 RepID=UPI000287D58D|nr:STAS domain-containing protein [Oceanobacillus massiliensis]